MKFSAVYALEKDIPFRVGIQAPLREALTTLVELGYDGVELHIPNPFEVEVHPLKRSVNEFGLEVPAISTGLSYIKYGYSLSSGDESNRLAATEFFKKYIEVAHHLDSRIVIVGTARGRCSGDCNSAKSRLVNSLKILGIYGRDMGVQLVLEPMNRRETDLINRVSEAIDIIKQVDNVWLLLDTYHLLIEEEDVYEVLQNYGMYARHIHVADSNRLAPGLGELRWDTILMILGSIGYNKYVSIEALMEPNYRMALEIAIKSLKIHSKNLRGA
ncbi:MAG: sugar phosphate isomerase/epimerase [Ignisphaera sp.]|nr:sugar phosphate isomerase/epimerase [Ignisphaera sp.]MCX8167845.1 sugar phosphate isomerase/epimerase [Ignisphaera sp.]MDW8086119.1 sugar phosphate isomerase/epimerase family protein [Ignisphaera sp.]